MLKVGAVPRRLRLEFGVSVYWSSEVAYRVRFCMHSALVSPLVDIASIATNVLSSGQEVGVAATDLRSGWAHRQRVHVTAALTYLNATDTGWSTMTCLAL